MHSHAGAWERENGQRNVCIPTQERGNEKMVFAGVWDAPFSLFSCSRVGTRNGQRNVCIPTQERGNEKMVFAGVWDAPFSLFPCSRVGTRNGQRNVCIPTQERGNEKYPNHPPSGGGSPGSSRQAQTPAGRGAVWLICGFPCILVNPFSSDYERPHEDSGADKTRR